MKKNKVKKYIFIVVDIVVIVFSVVLAALLRFEFSIPEYFFDQYTVFFIIIACATVALSVAFDCYSGIWQYFGFSDMIKQLFVAGVTFALLFTIKFTDIFDVSGSITVLYCSIFFVLSCAVRGIPRFHRWFVREASKVSGHKKRVLIAGAGSAGAMLGKHLLDTRGERLYPVGFLDDDKSKHGMRICGIKVLGEIEDAVKFVDELHVDELLIAMPSAGRHDMTAVFEKLSLANLPTKIFRNAVNVEDFNAGVNEKFKEVSIDDLLFREPVHVDTELNRSFIDGKTVLVTGGAGSIGSELCRQVLRNGCAFLVIYDISENEMFKLNEELKINYEGRFVTCMGSIRDAHRTHIVLGKYKPEIVFHAAAHKHVPMMEVNPFEAVKNNIFGTMNVLEHAIIHDVRKFVFISTDKAVNPVNIMGVSKRVCELIINTMSSGQTECVSVRFGNVLGSNGSVIPLFKKQIAEGGPLTLTHRDMTRYFMTIEEAVSLVLSAGASFTGSELFVLDMGEPVRIFDLATTLIRLSGKVPGRDIKIKEVGLRDGEKLFEELRLDSETVKKTDHKKIFSLICTPVDKQKLFAGIEKLEALLEAQNDVAGLKDVLFDMTRVSDV